MGDSSSSGRAFRKPRADAERNRNLLLVAAKQAFTEIGPQVCLEEIARRAGVGIGTLYRHFPTREAIVESVYCREVRQIADAAGALQKTLAPIEALRAWMTLFVDYVATKKIIAPALSSVAGGDCDLYAASGTQIQAAVTLLVRHAQAHGQMKMNLEPMDLVYALVGYANLNKGQDWGAGARRLIEVLIGGLERPPRPVSSRRARSRAAAPQTHASVSSRTRP